MGTIELIFWTIGIIIIIMATIAMPGFMLFWMLVCAMGLYWS